MLTLMSKLIKSVLFTLKVVAAFCGDAIMSLRHRASSPATLFSRLCVLVFFLQKT